MPATLEVLFAPAEFNALPARDLSQTTCVVFDVLRATSTMVTALAQGAASVIPVAEIPDALQIRQRDPKVLLAGERDGVRIEDHLTGGITFDLGNSPREFTRGKIAGKKIVMTTTNGTRALRACSRAKMVLLGSFLNLKATAVFLQQSAPANLLLVCGGTQDQTAYEDVLAAGALCSLVWSDYSRGELADSALMARELFQLEEKNLTDAFARSRNGKRLLAHKELREDLPYCAQRDVVQLVAKVGSNSEITAVSESAKTAS